MNRFLIPIALVMLVMTGCDRTIESKDPVRSVPEPPPSPNNIQILVNATSLGLDWSVTDSSDIVRYRIYVADTLPIDFRLHDSSTGTEATLTNLLINRLYYIRIASVDNSLLEGEPSSPVSATIGYTSIAINAGAEFTNSRNVSIQVNSSAPASQVILSEDSTFAGANFIPWAAERAFTLSAGDGDKIVYGLLVFGDGSRSGQRLEDRITLDTQAEIDSVFVIPANTVFGFGDVVTFGLDAGDLFGNANVSFTGVTGLALFDDGTNGDPTPNDGVYYGQYEVPVNANLYRDVVTGAFTDQAGNNALPVVATELLNFNTPPDPVDLALTINPLGQNEFTWTQSLEPDFQSYRLYASATSPVDTTDTEITIIRDPLVTIYVAPSDITRPYYRLFVFDQHGAAAGSDEVQ